MVVVAIARPRTLAPALVIAAAAVTISVGEVAVAIEVPTAIEVAITIAGAISISAIKGSIRYVSTTAGVAINSFTASKVAANFTATVGITESVGEIRATRVAIAANGSSVTQRATITDVTGLPLRVVATHLQEVAHLLLASATSLVLLGALVSGIECPTITRIERARLSVRRSVTRDVAATD